MLRSKVFAKRHHGRIVLLVLSAAASSGALTDLVAGTAGGSVASTATVIPACRALTIQPLAFGNYLPQTSVLNASAAFTVQCSESTPITVSLDRGSTPGASIANRKLVDPKGNVLAYQLYTTAARSAIWGDGTGGSIAITAVGLGLASTLQFTVYGTIPFGQPTAVPGEYTDTVTVTLDY